MQKSFVPAFFGRSNEVNHAASSTVLDGVLCADTDLAVDHDEDRPLVYLVLAASGLAALERS